MGKYVISANSIELIGCVFGTSNDTNNQKQIYKTMYKSQSQRKVKTLKLANWQIKFDKYTSDQVLWKAFKLLYSFLHPLSV